MVATQIFLEYSPLYTWGNGIQFDEHIFQRGWFNHQLVFFKHPNWLKMSFSIDTPPKTNLDIQNDGLEKVTPFKNGNFWYLC